MMRSYFSMISLLVVLLSAWHECDAAISSADEQEKPPMTNGFPDFLQSPRFRLIRVQPIPQQPSQQFDYYDAAREEDRRQEGQFRKTFLNRGPNMPNFQGQPANPPQSEVFLVEGDTYDDNTPSQSSNVQFPSQGQRSEELPPIVRPAPTESAASLPTPATVEETPESGEKGVTELEEVAPHSTTEEQRETTPNPMADSTAEESATTEPPEEVTLAKEATLEMIENGASTSKVEEEEATTKDTVMEESTTDKTTKLTEVTAGTEGTQQPEQVPTVVPVVVEDMDETTDAAPEPGMSTTEEAMEMPAVAGRGPRFSRA